MVCTILKRKEADLLTLQEACMNKLLLAMVLLIGLSGCATMESAWDSTKDASSDAYNWAFGDDDKKPEAKK